MQCIRVHWLTIIIAAAISLPPPFTLLVVCGGDEVQLLRVFGEGEDLDLPSQHHDYPAATPT